MSSIVHAVIFLRDSLGTLSYRWEAQFPTTSCMNININWVHNQLLRTHFGDTSHLITKPHVPIVAKETRLVLNARYFHRLIFVAKKAAHTRPPVS